MTIGTRNAGDTLTIGGAIGETSPVGLNKVGSWPRVASLA